MTTPINSITFEQAASLWSYEPATGVLCRLRDGAIVGQRQANPYDYPRVSALGRSFMAHRIVWLLATGAWPCFEIDHINGNRADKRFVNLRDVPHSVNQLNQNYHREGISRGPKIRANKAATRAAIARIDAERAAARVTQNAILVTPNGDSVTAEPVTSSRAHALSEGRSHCHSDVNPCDCDFSCDSHRRDRCATRQPRPCARVPHLAEAA